MSLRTGLVDSSWILQNVAAKMVPLYCLLAEKIGSSAALSACVGNYARECSELAWGCTWILAMVVAAKMVPLCQWVKKWFIAVLWLGGTMQGNVLNWLGIVVDSAICGCKNGSSLPVRREKMPGKTHRCHCEA